MEAVSIAAEKAVCRQEHLNTFQRRHKYIRFGKKHLVCSRIPSFPPGAFMLLYVFLLLIIGVPLFFMELAAGQSIRQGSIGVWKHISPNLAGIGYSSCIVRVLMGFGGALSGVT